MSVQESHVPLERLTALAVTARDADEQDRQLLVHVSACDQCSATLARLTLDLDALRDAAWDEVDRVFDQAHLEAQRSRILDRLAHLGQVARVIRFPVRPRDAAMPVSNVSRRWVSVAAAAGLTIGLVAGQMLHFVPWDARLHRPDRASRLQAADTSDPPAIMQATSGVWLSDDDLLDEVGTAVQLRRAAALRALDALTPTTIEWRDIP